MPPSFSHAVYTPENCLAVGGQIYTTANFGRSIGGLKVQEDYPEISNEGLDSDIYDTLSKILSGCGPITSSAEKAQIISNCSLFPTSASPPEYSKLSKLDLRRNLTTRRMAFSPKANKSELVELFKEDDRKTKDEHKAREQF